MTISILHIGLIISSDANHKKCIYWPSSLSLQIRIQRAICKFLHLLCPTYVSSSNNSLIYSLSFNNRKIVALNTNLNQKWIDLTEDILEQEKPYTCTISETEVKITMKEEKLAVFIPRDCFKSESEIVSNLSLSNHNSF